MPQVTMSRRNARADELSESQFERILANGSRIAIVVIGLVIAFAALQATQVLLAPVTLAVVIGLMFGPIADWMERSGIAPQFSAGIVVLLFVAIIFSGVLLFAVPLSEWVGKAPAIWQKLQAELENIKEPMEAVRGVIAQVQGIFSSGASAMQVRVQEGDGLINIAMFFPAIGAQILIFLASLYFYVATRDHIRISILSLCVTRRMRWRTAHVFRDVEMKVSRFLMSVTVINLCVGTAVTIVMTVIGMPSPLLWGGMAAVLNYIPYVGQAIMVVVLVSVGLGTQTGLEHILLPVGCYLCINFIEGQIVTPQLIGRTMTLNPFLIFLSITFWLWAWGPVGGLIAVPSLLIVTSILGNILPSKPVRPQRPVRRTANMTDNDLMLANAAAAIREKAEAEQSKEKRLPPAGTAPDGATSVPGT